MGRKSHHSQLDRAVAAEASQWLERLPQASPAEREAFAQWLRQSPIHVRELLLSDFVDDALSHFDSERKLPITLPASDSNVIPLTDRIAGSDDSPAPRKGRKWPWIGAIAAAVTAVAIGLLMFVTSPNTDTYATGVGEHRTIALTDGSVVTLSVKTELDVAFSRQWRDIHLRSGQALFTVAHDSSRPFRVHVNGTTVKAVGTKFDVRLAGARTLVYVVEGRVRIEQPELAGLTLSPVRSPRLPALELTPGESATIRQDGEVAAMPNVSEKSMSAWQSRRLVFEERQLADIADEFSAYVRSPTLTVEGTELQQRLYTGSFDADRLDSFIDYLQRDPSIEIVRQGSRVIVKPAPTPVSATP